MELKITNNYVKNPQRAANKRADCRIAQLEKELKSLDAFDDTIKTRMQDRMKFMSAKNARREQSRLNQVCKSQEAIRAELSSLQQR